MPRVEVMLVHVGSHRLRYLLTSEHEEAAALVTTSGAPSPDLLTDSVQGPIKRIVRAPLDGHRGVGPGPLTRAQAHALWATVRLRTVGRSGTALFAVDVDIDAAGRPQLVVMASGRGTGYLDIEA